MVEDTAEVEGYYIGVRGEMDHTVPYRFQAEAQRRRNILLADPELNLSHDEVIVVRGTSNWIQAARTIQRWHAQKETERIEALRAYYDAHDTSDELRAALEDYEGQ